MKLKYILIFSIVLLIVYLLVHSYSVPNTIEERRTDKIILTIKGQYLEYITKHPNENREQVLTSILKANPISDAWGRNIEIVKNGDDLIVRSAGKDGKFGTEDDIKW